MATSAENLQTAIDNISLAILAASTNPKPNYSVNGQSVSWGDYISQLVKAQSDLQDRLNILLGPGEYVVEGVT